jgi:hypothetical protein
LTLDPNSNCRAFFLYLFSFLFLIFFIFYLPSYFLRAREQHQSKINELRDAHRQELLDTTSRLTQTRSDASTEVCNVPPAILQ